MFTTKRTKRDAIYFLITYWWATRGKSWSDWATDFKVWRHFKLLLQNCNTKNYQEKGQLKQMSVNFSRDNLSFGGITKPLTSSLKDIFCACRPAGFAYAKSRSQRPCTMRLWNILNDSKLVHRWCFRLHAPWQPYRSPQSSEVSLRLNSLYKFESILAPLADVSFIVKMRVYALYWPMSFSTCSNT